MNIQRQQAQRTSVFTLIELIVVIGIVGVMMGILFASGRMFANNSVTVAASQVSAQLNLARQHAIAKRQYVAVVFPDASATTNAMKYTMDDGTSVPIDISAFPTYPDLIRRQLEDRWSTSFGYVEVEKSSGEWKAKALVAGTAWDLLPTGSAILEAVEGNNRTFHSGDTSNPSVPVVTTSAPASYTTFVHDVPMAVEILSTDTTPPTLPAGLTTSNKLTRITLDYLPGIVFKPNGSLASSLPNSSAFYVSVGAYIYLPDPSDNPPGNSTPFQKWIKADHANCATIEINKHTGKARVIP